MLPNDTSSKKTSSNSTSRNFSDDIESIKKDGRHIAETIYEQGQDQYDHLKQSSSRYIKMLEERVSAKPLQSVALAIGAGMLLSFLLRRG